MPDNPVVFIDTSVLLNMLQVPGRCDDYEKVNRDWEGFQKQGCEFVIPVTALIETGNHIAQCEDGNARFEAAQRFVEVIEKAAGAEPPWIIRDTKIGSDFLASLIAGDSTGTSLPEHFKAKTGAGDLAILVERDQFKSAMPYTDVRIWTLDHKLDSLANASHRTAAKSPARRRSRGGAA